MNIAQACASFLLPGNDMGFGFFPNVQAASNANIPQTTKNQDRKTDAAATSPDTATDGRRKPMEAPKSWTREMWNWGRPENSARASVLKAYAKRMRKSAAAENHPVSLTRFEDYETLRDKFYCLLRDGLRQKGSALHSIANGAMGYGIYNLADSFPLFPGVPAKLYAGCQGLFCFAHIAISISSTLERQQFQDDLRKLGFDENFIERLSSLPFDEQGLREAARLLQKRNDSEDLDLSGLANDFIEKYMQEPRPMGYQVVQYFSRIFTEKTQPNPNPA